MGLDTYASRSPDDVELTDEDSQAFVDADIQLCGGMFSGEGGSFRGKVYATLILEITDESLYQQWIPPETVRQIYLKLMEFDVQRNVEVDDEELVSLPDLIKYFKVCSERGLGLIGWW